ncbi:hypothetical protein LX36DRAFT_591748, partial [Colletotrichum falcatum]
VSIVGHKQYFTLYRYLNIKITLDTLRASKVGIRFSSRELFKLIRAIKVPTLLGKLTFYVITLDTPFLLCLKDIDRHNVIFNNIINLLVKGNNEIIIPIVRK